MFIQQLFRTNSKVLYSPWTINRSCFYPLMHYNAIPRASWYLISPDTYLSVQQIVQANFKVNSLLSLRLPHTSPAIRKSFPCNAVVIGDACVLKIGAFTAIIIYSCNCNSTARIGLRYIFITRPRMLHQVPRSPFFRMDKCLPSWSLMYNAM